MKQPGKIKKIHFHGKIKGLYQRNLNYKCKYKIINTKSISNTVYQHKRQLVFN